jgi:hypothetical protein
MSLARLSLLLALVGAALVVVGLLVGPADLLRAEGAYFMRAAGTAAHGGSFHVVSSGDVLLSPRDGNLWLGAGIACLVLSGGALAAHAKGLRLERRD